MVQSAVGTKSWARASNSSSAERRSSTISRARTSEGGHKTAVALFQRIVPIVKDVGLWGPRIRKCYEEMGVLDFANQNVEELQKADESIALEFDARRRHIESIAARAGGATATAAAE